MMSYYAKAKGTSIEKSIQSQMQAELSGAGMYFSLARLAKEHKLNDVAEKFIELANEHAQMTSFYAEFCGRYPLKEHKFWQFIKGLSKSEYFGKKAMSEFADAIKKAGFFDVAEIVKTFALQHEHHAEVTSELVEKYAPESVKIYNSKHYVCNICGYEYIGDLDKEPDDFTCPVCTCAKNVFKLADV